ncbi:ArnT family glycosyltransferase [Thermodesulfobacteriota bacterium]
MNYNKKSLPTRNIHPGWLLAVTLVFLAETLPHIGHILSFDEAWILCALRSIAVKSELFADQFYRHPPILMELGMLLAPAKQNFELRMELLCLFLNILALLVFLKFTAYFFGKRIALFTGLIYILAPGSVFFAVWVKRDCIVSLFGILAVWSSLRKKEWLAGIFLGLAFLGKEMAIFYAILITLSQLLSRQRKPLKGLLKIYTLTAFISGWWYLLFANENIHYINFFRGVSDDYEPFAMPWWYYLDKIRFDLGWVGAGLFLLGIVGLFLRRRKSFQKETMLNSLGRVRYLPILILVPSFLILSISAGKAGWWTITLQYWLALVAGIGGAFLCKIISRSFAFLRLQIKDQRKDQFAYIFVFVLLLPQAIAFNYIATFDRLCPDMLRPTRESYIMADLIQSKVQPMDAMLFYPNSLKWNNTALDPITFWNINVPLIIFNQYAPRTITDLKKIIHDFKIRWVLIYPVIGTFQDDIYGEIVKEINPVGYWTPGGILLEFNDPSSSLDEK